ncbi:nicotinate (nicotinamide) nucleotide adenylyltransferase [Candidatus Parcubacteria bacterium]|nr:nicotinate (nicotinamide) nucleotide adenylyltransferase [Candidatus Parcubacteria bacterium]
MGKIGLLFGSFNPVHNGHRAIAEAALAQAGCDEVWFIVQSDNRYKQQPNLLPIAHRLALTRLAVSPHARIKVRPGASDMITTLRTLPKQTASRYVLLMGQDLAATLPQWPDGDKILEMGEIYYYPRRDNQAPIRLQYPHLHALRSDGIDISSAQIRQLLAQHQPITNLVPPPVADYIQAHQLYTQS